MRTLAVFLALVLLAGLAWVFFQSSEVSIVVNGRQLGGTEKFAAEGWGLLVAIVALFCVAILLAFALAGLGLLFLGLAVLGGMAAAWLMFPFLWPVLIPLLVVWLFVAIVRNLSRRKP